MIHPRGSALEKDEQNMDQEVSASAIRELRKRLGLTQEEFAHAVAVTFSTVNRWENGHAKPSKLARRAIEALSQSGRTKKPVENGSSSIEGLVDMDYARDRK